MKHTPAIRHVFRLATLVLACAGLSSARGATNILSEGFEGVSSGVWTVGDTNLAGTSAYWASVDNTFGTVPARTGGRKGYCAGIGYAGSKPNPLYPSDMYASMRTSLNLLSACDATLTFWYQVPSIDSCCDSFQVNVGGATLFSNSEPALLWTQVLLSLRAVAGQVVDLEFVFASDSSGQFEGVYLDDIAVTADPAMATIADAGWGPTQDHDADGCLATPDDTFELVWNSRVSCATPLSVYEKIYRRHSGYTTWNLLVTTSPHTITASAGGNQQSTNVPAGSFCSGFDYRIEVYKQGASSPDDARDSTNDPELAGHREEHYSEDECLATIWNAWWGSVQDDDADGCLATPKDFMRLYWDSDVLNCRGSLTVYEKLYRRSTGSTNWVEWVTTTPHVVTGDSSADIQFVESASDPTCAASDFMIEVYRLGQITPDYRRYPDNDAELSNHREEAFSQDDCLATIADAWLSPGQDQDGDGCLASSSNKFVLYWDAKVRNCTNSLVYEKVYFQVCDSPAWSCLATTVVHAITGSSPTNVQYLELPATSPCACFNYKIEIYRASRDLPDFTRGPDNDVDLAGHREESFLEDDCSLSMVVITDAWWSNSVDTDGDGCWEPLAWSGGLASQRLNWNPDLTPCHGSISVYEKVYWRLRGESSWSLWTNTSPHTVTGQRTGDRQFADIPAGLSCDARDYKIEIFRTGQTTPDYARDPSNDPDLALRSEEALERPVLTIFRVPEQNVVLSWPSNFVGFRLEVTPDLGTQTWVTCSPDPVVVATEWMVTNQLDTNRYYRLAKP